MNCPKCGCTELEQMTKDNFFGHFEWKVCKNCKLEDYVFPKYKPRLVTHLSHHMWCNFFMRDVVSCTSCNPINHDGLWERYPYNPYEPDEIDLAAKYFPNAVRVG